MIKKVFKKFTALGMILTISTTSINQVYAGDPLGKAVRFIRGKNGMVSYNKGRGGKGQMRGNYFGGSVSRQGDSPQRLTPLRVTGPQFGFDACTGSFDAYLGSFSYIRGPQFTKFFQGVASAAPGYLAQLAMKEVSPQIEYLMSYMESVTRDINGMTMDQCLVGQQLAQGLYSTIVASNNTKCKMHENNGNKPDGFASTEACAADPDKHQDTEDEDFKSMLGANYNLVWKALSKDAAIASKLKLTMMSITGSVIGKSDEDGISLSVLPSLVLSDELLDDYIGIDKKGGNVEIYQCDDSQNCLNPFTAKVDASGGKNLSVYAEIEKQMSTLIDKITSDNDEPITEDEHIMLQNTLLPIMRITEAQAIMSSREAAKSYLKNPQFLQLLTYDVAITIMVKTIDNTHTAVEKMEAAQLDTAAFEKFEKQVDRVRTMLRDKKQDSWRQMEVITNYISQVKQQEDYYYTSFARYVEVSTNSQ